MVADAAANFHDVGSGRGTNGMMASPATDEPATMIAVSSSGWPPGADLSSAFQPACSKPAASTASVTPSESSEAGIAGRAPHAERGLPLGQLVSGSGPSSATGETDARARAGRSGSASFNRVRSEEHTSEL